MGEDQVSKTSVKENNIEMSDKTKEAMKESIMDFAGHFSTASAILAGFYMATCAFIISIKAQGAEVFMFLDEPLLAEIPILGDLILEILTSLKMESLWPSHFEYMLIIFISLFLLSLLSYACFLRVGMVQMSIYRLKQKPPEEKLLVWQERGMYSLLISLIFSFITLPWALLRFIVEQALVLAFILLAIVITSLALFLKGRILVKKRIGKI